MLLCSKFLNTSFKDIEQDGTKIPNFVYYIIKSLSFMRKDDLTEYDFHISGLDDIESFHRIVRD